MNKSLLQREIGKDRFTIHKLLRQFAALKRRQIDPDDQALQDHAHYFANLVPGEVRRSLFRWPYLLRRRHSLDRENFYRAWDYALQSGRAEDLAN